MSHILIATDFSEVAENAVRFGCRLAQDMNCTVTVVHCFMIPITFNDNPMPIVPIDEGREIAENRLRKLTEELQSEFPGLSIEQQVMFGDVADCIEDYTEEHKVWLVVLGNSGSGASGLWLGSNVVNALRNLHVNVLAVPAGYGYKKPGKICFACDYRNITEQFRSGSLLDIVHRTGAQLHVLNVSHEQDDAAKEMAMESSALHREIGAAHPVYHYAENEDTNEGINTFVTDNHMDWLVIAPHKYSFFEGLFHKSHTKAMVKMSRIPLIALHEG